MQHIIMHNKIKIYKIYFSALLIVLVSKILNAVFCSGVFLHHCVSFDHEWKMVFKIKISP